MKKEKISVVPDQAPKNLMNEETMYMLAQWWADPQIKNYFVNERLKQIWSLRNIKTDTIEGDALELARRNGRISYVEELLHLMKIAYEDNLKIKEKYAKREKTQIHEETRQTG